MTNRPVRNNNPGDLDSGSPWQGLQPVEKMTPEQRDEPRFAVFSTPAFGFRALALLLCNYQSKHGCKTIIEIVSRWAPPSENRTEAYIAFVARAMEVPEDAPISLHDRATLFKLAKAIATYETGHWGPDWSDEMLNTGLDLLPKGLLVPTEIRLGKKAPKVDQRTFAFARYLPAELPAIPPSADWGSKIADWGMMLNDAEGDCTCAGVGHAVLAFTTDAGDPSAIADASVQALYIAITGAEGGAFNPATGENDNGCAEIDVLNYWRKNGFAGHGLGGYANINPQNLDHVKLAIALYGVCYIGVGLPLSAQSQDEWAITDPSLAGDAAPGSWGGHCVILTAYDTVAKIFTCITWGAEKKLTEAWFQAYCDEAYALFSPDWVTGIKPAPSGFNLAQLQADLSALQS